MNRSILERGGRWMLVMASVCAAAMAVGACGSDDDSDNSGGSASGGGSASDTGGKVAYSSTKLLDQYTVIMSDLVQRDAT